MIINSIKKGANIYTEQLVIQKDVTICDIIRHVCVSMILTVGDFVQKMGHIVLLLMEIMI